MAYSGYILPEHVARIKEVMRSTAVNRDRLSRKIIKEYANEFRFFQKIYPGIDFKLVAITAQE